MGKQVPRLQDMSFMNILSGKNILVCFAITDYTYCCSFLSLSPCFIVFFFFLFFYFRDSSSEDDADQQRQEGRIRAPMVSQSLENLYVSIIY